MRWLQIEYILKGIYLGLLLFVALQEPDWGKTGLVLLFTLGGLAVCLGIAAVPKLREGYQIKGRLPAFILFLLLESHGLVYVGVLLGMTFGAISVKSTDADRANLLLPAVLGGGVLGYVFWLLRHVQEKRVRLWLSLALAVVVVSAILLWFGQSGLEQIAESIPRLKLQNAGMVGVQLLLGIPIFYLLTFAGQAEESEVEIGAICAVLALGMGMATREYLQAGQAASLVVPVMLYFYYTWKIQPGLRVFKYVVRGISYANVGKYRPALLAFRRALELDPKNVMAREALWSVHRAMDFDQVARDPATLALIDLDMCMDRAGALLMNPPTAARLQEAERLLNLVLTQRPVTQPRIQYWRAIAATHAHNLDQATAELESLLDPAHYSADDPHRLSVLLPAWQLALTLHPELNRRVGTPQLALPGRRMEAIAAVERHLAENPGDSAVWDMKRFLYANLAEADYLAGGREFDHEYAQQLGLALISDPARWQRGAEYLRIAARGLPEQGPTIFTQIAQAYERAGDADGVRHSYELAKQAGRKVGQKNLGEADRQAYFAALKTLADAAMARGDVDAAIEDLRLYSEYERSGLETLRLLAELYEKKGDPLAALRANDQALLYDPKNKELLARKDKYYYSVMPDALKARLEAFAGGFDVAYCLQKARALLDAKEADLEIVDWALHLAELVQVVKPDSLAAKFQRGRARLRRGEKEEAIALFEEMRANKPEKFATTEDEHGWYHACKQLGELYLYELGRPDTAIECFLIFRKTQWSGGETMYRLGQAYEQVGDPARAIKCYEQVTAYDGHPLAPDAREALYRLKSK